jgi:hypothetical protein
MSRADRLFPTLVLATLLIVGCSGAPEKPQTPTFAPVVSDQRGKPFETAKSVEEDGVRLYVGESFFGPTLIDLFHREVALNTPRLPRQYQIDVTDLEVSVLVSGGNFLVDPSRALVGSDRYRPTPGALVLDELGPDASQSVRVRIAYRVDGKAMEEMLQGAANSKQIRERAGELYRDAIVRIVQGLERNG